MAPGPHVVEQAAQVKGEGMSSASSSTSWWLLGCGRMCHPAADPRTYVSSHCDAGGKRVATPILGIGLCNPLGGNWTV